MPVAVSLRPSSFSRKEHPFCPLAFLSRGRRVYFHIYEILLNSHFQPHTFLPSTVAGMLRAHGLKQQLEAPFAISFPTTRTFLKSLPNECPFSHSLSHWNFIPFSIMGFPKGKEINTDQESTVLSQKFLIIVSFRMPSAACYRKTSSSWPGR